MAKVKLSGHKTANNRNRADAVEAYEQTNSITFCAQSAFVNSLIV